MDLKDTVQKLQEMTLAASDKPLTEAITLNFLDAANSYQAKVETSQNGSRKLGEIIQPFRPPKLEVTTLTGFIDAIKSGVAGDIKSNKVIHVEDYLTVSVKETVSDAYGIRNTLLKATHTPIDAFRFDVYYDDPQKFIIALQIAFVPDQQLLDIIKLTSVLKAGRSIETNDDGFSQTITVKQGEVGTADVKIPPRVKLIPLRSFSEANESNPVSSEFLLRFKANAESLPAIALFSVDGNKYKGQIMQSIKHYLAKHLPDVPILA
jgi:hypothetical protein